MSSCIYHYSRIAYIPADSTASISLNFRVEGKETQRNPVVLGTAFVAREKAPSRHNHRLGTAIFP